MRPHRNVCKAGSNSRSAHDGKLGPRQGVGTLILGARQQQHVVNAAGEAVVLEEVCEEAAETAQQAAGHCVAIQLLYGTVHGTHKGCATEKEE